MEERNQFLCCRPRVSSRSLDIPPPRLPYGGRDHDPPGRYRSRAACLARGHQGARDVRAAIHGNREHPHGVRTGVLL